MANTNMNPHSPDFAESQEGEMNLVAEWTRVDPIRWVSGILAGLLAGAVAMLVAGVIATWGGFEFWFPIKLMATPILGSTATEIGMNLGPIIVGLMVIEFLAVFWGVIYSHFVYSNNTGPLLAMGLVWGVYLWIFNWNLYFQSFKTISVTNLPRSWVMVVCLSYGLSLSTVRFFDRAFRG